MFFDKVVASVSKSGIVPVDCNHMWLRATKVPNNAKVSAGPSRLG